MGKKPGFREMILRAKNGDMEASLQLVRCVYPVIKKYGFQLGYIGACSDLILWMLSNVKYYRYYSCSPDLNLPRKTRGLRKGIQTRTQLSENNFGHIRTNTVYGVK